MSKFNCRMNNEAQMTNDQIPMTNTSAFHHWSLVLVHWSFLRHLMFVIRHYELWVDLPHDHPVAGHLFDRHRRSLGDQLAVADAIDDVVAKLNFAGWHKRRHRHAALAGQ